MANVLAAWKPVGLDAGQTEFDTLGETGGAKTHTLTTAELAVHTHGTTEAAHGHNVTDPAHNHAPPGGMSYYAGFGSGIGGASHEIFANPLNAGYWSSTGNATTGISIVGNTTGLTVNNAGSGNAHNNLQPYVVMNYIIRYA